MSGYDVLANGKRYFFKAPEWDTGRKHAPAAPPCGWDEFTRRLTMTLIEYFGHPRRPGFPGGLAG